MAHIRHEHINYIEDTIKEYPEVTTYLIGMETKDYEHMHFVVNATSQTWYRNFSKRVFIDKFGLRGRARKDAPRQYGKISKIKDVYLLKCYTVKDQNIRTNMPQQEIDDYIENSTKKVELEGYYSSFLAKIDDFVEKRNDDYTQSRREICKQNFDTHEKNQNLERVSRREHDDLPEDVKIFIIKELQAEKFESITKGKIDSIWNRWQTKNCTPSQIYYYIYKKRA